MHRRFSQLAIFVTCWDNASVEIQQSNTAPVNIKAATKRRATRTKTYRVDAGNKTVACVRTDFQASKSGLPLGASFFALRKTEAQMHDTRCYTSKRPGISVRGKRLHSRLMMHSSLLTAVQIDNIQLSTNDQDEIDTIIYDQHNKHTNHSL